ncbi:MAG: phosphotransferase family protein [Solirubrobacteraceae bacterium]
MNKLDPGELVRRGELAARQRWPAARIEDLEPLQGGISSLTFSAALREAGEHDGRVVLKVAPPGLAPVRNRDVLRQARVLRALHGVPGVCVPEVVFEDDGSPPFFVMEFVPGEAYEPKWDVSDSPPTAEVVRTRALGAATMLARLQAVTPETVGLADEPALSLADELQRWSALFATAGDDLRGDELSLQRALAERIPAGLPARILHGDYRLGNMQFAGERLAAIIDWELWSLGDPRNDLAWVMAFADPIQQRVSARDPANQAAADAMPGPGELLSEYLETSGGDVPADLNWFVALCYYKLGATMSVLAKRNRRLDEPDPGLELVAQTTPPMLEHALALLV